MAHACEKYWSEHKLCAWCKEAVANHYSTHFCNWGKCD